MRDTSPCRTAGLARAPASAGPPAALGATPSVPSPARSIRVLHCLLALVACAVTWAALGRLDIVAVADGRLVPRLTVPIVQPATAAIVREILVNDGETVLPGQVLFRLDASEVEAETRALQAELTARLLQLRRIDAELAGAPLGRLPDDADETFARAFALQRANRAAHLDALAQESAVRNRIAQELSAATEVAVKLARTLPIYRTMADRYRQLQREGFVSELYALEREREWIEKEQDLRAQQHTVGSLRAALVQAERRLAQVTSGYRAQLHAERAQAESQRSRVAEELAKGLARAAGIELRAPQAGVVKELATHAAGAVVAGGAVLATLVPAGEELQAEVLIRDADIGFVRAGQPARVKLVAFPFQKYGLVEGTVLRVSPDASIGSPPRGGPADAAMAAASGYRARVALAAQSLLFDGQPLALTAGMGAVAEIRLGERTLLEYLVAPVRRAWHDAARER